MRFSDHARAITIENEGVRTRYRIVAETDGDVDQDGNLDQVAVIEMETSGTGVFLYLTIILDGSCRRTPVEGANLGDRISIGGLRVFPRDHIDAGMIVVGIRVRAAGQAYADTPTLYVSRMYRLVKGRLVQIEQYLRVREYGGNLMISIKTHVLLVALATGLASQASAQQYVYPAAGQSPEQQSKDEFDCHQWAVQQTGIDPTKPAQTSTESNPPTRSGGRVARGAARGALAGWAVGSVAGGDRSDTVIASAAIGGVGSGLRSRRQRNDVQQSHSQRQNQAAGQYNRARSACLEAKGYTVK